MTGIARRRIPVLVAVPVQLTLGLDNPRPITHRHRKVTQNPAPIVAVAVRRAA